MKKGDNDIIKVLGDLDNELIEEADPYRADAGKKTAVGRSVSPTTVHRLRIAAGIAAAAIVLVIGIAFIKKGLTKVKPGNDNRPGSGQPAATATQGVTATPIIGDATTPTMEPLQDTPTPTPEIPQDTPTPEVPKYTPTPTPEIPQYTPTPEVPKYTPTPTPEIPQDTPTPSESHNTPTPTMTMGVPSPTPTPSAYRGELTEESAHQLIYWFTSRLDNWGHFDQIYVLVFPEDKIEEITERYRAEYGMPEDCTLYEYVEAQHEAKVKELYFESGHLQWHEWKIPGSTAMSLRDAGSEIRRMIQEDGVELPEDATVCVEDVTIIWHYDDKTIEGTKQICVYSYNGCLYIAGILVDEWM